MEKIWTTALRDSISDVFSTMFFLVPEEDPSLAQALADKPAQHWLEGWLEVKQQEENVMVWIWAPPELARELAANIFSMEPEEVSQDDLLDAFREMLNMVVGSLLTIVDKESLWRMDLPQARHLEAGLLGEVAAKAQWVLSYDVEEKPLLAGCWSQQV